MTTWARFGSAVSLVTQPAPDGLGKVAMEMIEGGSGRLLPDRAVEVADAGTSFAPGDVLFGKLRPYLAKVWLADHAGAAVGDLHVYRPKAGHDPRYLRYCILGGAFIEEVTSSTYGTKMPRANWSFIKNVSVRLPPHPRQVAIVDFLDRGTAKIDALIEKQKELIGLLRERRLACRSALALGLGQAQAKDSSLVWAGQIPSHWTVVPLLSLAKLESGHTPSRTRPELWQDCHIPWISLHDVSRLSDNEYIDWTTNMISDAGIRASSARLLPAGTVVLSRDATIGRSSIMRSPMATSQHFAAWVCGPRLSPRYLWLLLTSAMQPYFSSLTNGATLRTIGMDDLRSLRIPLPPLAEQEQLVTSAALETARIDALIAKAEQFIELARERRAALITAAVTGQIDVPGGRHG